MTTNLERIRQMTTDELAEILSSRIKCSWCIYEYCNLKCKDGVRNWLEQEVEE